jgi:diguanylate cyclase (GGDEF)-like protein
MNPVANSPDLKPFVDTLTGLHNRRGFLLLAEHQHRAQQRTGVPAALFRIDVDGLDQIGSEHGRDETDAVLVAIGDLLRLTFRDADIAARVGHDQFAVLAVDCDGVEGLQHRLHSHVAEYTELFPRPYALSVNVHVTTLGGGGVVEALLPRRRGAESHAH